MGLCRALDRVVTAHVRSYLEPSWQQNPALLVVSAVLGVQVADIWDAAGHALHPDSCMQCWLLPCSLSADIEEHTPLVEEQRRLKQMQRAARMIQRCWRVRNLVRTVKQYARRQGYVLPGVGASRASACSAVMRAACKHALLGLWQSISHTFL